MRDIGGSYLLDIKQYGTLYLGAWVSADTIYGSLGGGSDERPTFSLVSDAGALMAGGGSSVLPPGLDYTGR